MSEYQYVHFLAIDRPPDDRQLEYMEQQSTRAEITRWEFTNEYNYGDFRGNARENDSCWIEVGQAFQPDSANSRSAWDG